MSRVHFTFDTLPGVTFEVTRLQLAQSDAAFEGTFPAGWLDIVGVLDATGAVVHQSGIAGPTDASTPQNAAARPSEPKASHEPVEFTFDNFSQATFVAIRSNEKQETVTPWGREVREAGWVDLFVTLNDGTWQIGGFAAPTAP